MRSTSFSRRDFVRTSAALALVAAASPVVAAAAASPKWKTAVGLNGFLSSASKYKKHYPIWEIPDPYDAAAKGKKMIDAARSESRLQAAVGPARNRGGE